MSSIFSALHFFIIPQSPENYSMPGKGRTTEVAAHHNHSKKHVLHVQDQRLFQRNKRGRMKAMKQKLLHLPGQQTRSYIYGTNLLDEHGQTANLYPSQLFQQVEITWTCSLNTIMNVCRVPYDVCTKRGAISTLVIIMTLEILKTSLTKGGEKLRGLQHIPTNSVLNAIKVAVILVTLYLWTVCQKGNKMSIFQR